MPITILTIIILIMSAVFHEYAHGAMAHRLGDKTAEQEGRLTLNPLAHLDLFGSILLPLLLVLTKAGFILGWAKPVPYNPRNLNDFKYGELKVALAGPGTNFFLALFFGGLTRFLPIADLEKQNLALSFLSGDNNFLLSAAHDNLIASIFIISIIACFLNLLLGIFNLVPIPPLDGSKVLMAFLPPKIEIAMQRIEPYGSFIILFLLMSGFFSVIWPVIIYAFSFITGL